MARDKFFKSATEAITSQVGKRCFGRLHVSEQRLGALFIVMQLPRRIVPGGLGWVKIRYYRYVALAMAHQQESSGQTTSFSDMRSNIEVRIMSLFKVRPTSAAFCFLSRSALSSSENFPFLDCVCLVVIGSVGDAWRM